MPSILRRWVALEGHETVLRQELLRAHEVYTQRLPYVRESLMYREHFLGVEFIGLVVYADDAGLVTTERQRAMARLDEVAAAHAKVSTPPLRAEMIDEFVMVPHAGPYGIAGLLTCQPPFAAEFAERLKRLSAELIQRLRPTRMLVGEVVDAPGMFFILGDSNYPVDLDRYFRSSLYRQHVATLGSMLAAPTRWFSLDPVWRYHRGATG